MIKQLYIQNFTLIDELNIDFHSGFPLSRAKQVLVKVSFSEL